MSTGKQSLDESLTNIQWLCNLESAEILTADKVKKEEWKYQEPISTNPFTKPPYSYATLILMAINSSDEKRMTLQHIYRWIETNYPFYKTCKKAWKNSIRHNLSLYNFFIKEKRPSNLPGKGSYWSISAEGKENMMKEVLKHQQPVLNSLEYLQGHSKGLRPILPKPSSTDGSPNNGVQLVGDSSVPGLPQGIPIVILPTQLYISMANKLAAQAATGDGSAIGIRPGQFASPMEASVCGLQSATSSTENFDARPTVVKNEGDSPSVDCTTTCSRSMNNDSEDSLQMYQEFALPTLVLPESMKHQITSSSSPTPTTSGFDSGIDCSPTVCEIDSSSECTDCKAQKKQKGRNFGEPTPKRAKQQKKKPIKASCSTMPAGHVVRTPSQRSPLREHSQPTLAAINSNSNIMVSPTSILKTFSAGLLGNELSPLQATPTKDSGNPLTDGFLSPSTSAALGCNYPQAFTPLKFDSDSGLFTPFADRDFDCGFLISPSRYSSVLTPSKLRSTPQSCRKSLGLGVLREEGQGNDYLDWFQL